mmetsp:Transcript_59154/g.95617  ORF Transcript_59154/g.95617 Transcript_59154/m.95617 type:complete len:794 (-) Transcript_59154:664-3045(-)|eukprot:CAMPEP_0179434728 /NCGR_PEP_ID=MMETSP0799-20121207/18991_1 /TAXON_ID=46947 /ORGANISM="Geminigera cryophila, Strain CCMP2564" /LENGTH=793 /DNA_ID=CAMNT_0021213695 /DNA_START=193 /DNA_END=2574 /DNA_ORIENTATION=+
MPSSFHRWPSALLQLLLVLCASHAACYILAPAASAFVRPISMRSFRRPTPSAARQLRRPIWSPLPERKVSSGVLSALSTDRDVESIGITPTATVKLNGAAPLENKRNSTHTETKARGKMSQADLAAFEAAKSADMGIRYDPLTAEAEFNGRTLDVWRRDLQISVPLTTFLGSVLIDFQRGVEIENRALRATQFMEIIAGLGPAFIKAGQALSSRPDLLPPDYLRELQKLQDRLPPFPNDLAFKIIEEQLGRPMSEVFSRVEPEPVAAASIGQVYKGYLLTGEAVAIKVQRPECEEIIGLDIYILRELSGTLSSMIKLLRRDIDLKAIIEEFGKLIYEELDYLQEARNAQRFGELYGKNPMIYIPRIFWRYSRSKLLVMEWIDGLRLTSPLIPENQKTKLVQAMVQCSLQQILENGFFHADPHGGNLLAMADGRLVYLDFGMMSEVEAYQRYGILEAVIHLVNGDYNSLGKLYIRLGFIPPGTDLRPIESALAKALPDVLESSVDTLNIANVINQLGDVFYQFPFTLPSYYTAIVRCLGVLEGLAIQVDGKFRIINDAYPYVASRVLSDPQLQDILQYMVLTKEKTIRWQRLEGLLGSAASTGAAGVSSWDMSRTGQLMGDYIMSPHNRDVRDNIIDDLTDLLDTLGIESAAYLAAIIAAGPLDNSGGGGAVQRALAPVQLTAAALQGDAPNEEDPLVREQPQSVRNILQRLAMLRQNPSTTSSAMPMLQDLALTTLDRPEVQQLLVETASHLLERITTRAIRFAFFMPQPKARDLPRLASRRGHARPETPPSN